MILKLFLFSGNSDYIDHYGRSEIERLKFTASTKPTMDISKDSETAGGNLENSHMIPEPAPSDSDKRQPRTDHQISWYLLGLSGNTSLVHKRLPDFMNYLKINLGGLTGSDYENVTVNSVSYVPSLIVNISFRGNHNVSQLPKLSQ